MDGWVTGMLLPPVLPSDLAVLVPGNQKPTHPGLCQADLINAKECGFRDQAPPVCMSPGESHAPLVTLSRSFFFFLIFVCVHSVTFIDKLAPDTACNPLRLLKMQHVSESQKGREFLTLPGEQWCSLRALRQDALQDLRWSALQSVQVQPALYSYALYSFGFLCTRQICLPVCRKQSSCVPSIPVSSVALACEQSFPPGRNGAHSLRCGTVSPAVQYVFVLLDGLFDQYIHLKLKQIKCNISI